MTSVDDDRAELRAQAEPPAIRRLTVTGTSYGDQRLTATSWDRDEREGLIVLNGNQVIAEFHPGQWYGIIDEAHRDPDCLKITRDALDDIRHAIRHVPFGDYGDEDLLVVALRRIDEIASEAKAASYLHNSEPF